MEFAEIIQLYRLQLYRGTSTYPSDFSTPLDRSELILRMSGGIESGEFAQSLPPVIDTFKVRIPKSSQTVGEITVVQYHGGYGARQRRVTRVPCAGGRDEN